MIHNKNISSFFASILIGLALLLATQVSAQTKLEFTTRLDAATAAGSGLNYAGAAPGLRMSYSFTSVNQVSPKTSLLYAISYASSGFNRGAFGICGNSFDGLDTETISDVLENMSYDIVQARHLSLPIGIRHTLKEGKKWSIYGQGMLEPMVYLQSKFTNFEDGQEPRIVRERDGSTNNFQLAAGFAAGFERPFLEFWTLAIRPTLRVHLLNELKNTELLEANGRYMTAGLAFSLGYKF